MQFRQAPSQHNRPQTVAQPPATAVHKQRRERGVLSFLRRRWAVILIVLALIGIGMLTYGYLNTKNELKKLSDPKVAGQTELQQITNQVSKYLQLPTGETPTLATVNDASKLKNQQFFARAQNGDKVLIYSHAGRALLYRPSTKKVIEYAPVNLGSNQ